MLTMRFCFASGVERFSLRTAIEETKPRVYMGMGTATRFTDTLREARRAWRKNMAGKMEVLLTNRGQASTTGYLLKIKLEFVRSRFQRPMRGIW